MENKKSLIALAIVALVGVVGATFAYYTSSAKLTNEFTTGTYTTSVTEEFVSPDNWTPGTTTPKIVTVTNNGNVDIAVRAIYTEKWTAKDGTVLDGFRSSGKVAHFTIGSDWEEALDGYYYYKNILGYGETSAEFISSVTFNPNFILEEGADIKCTTTNEEGKTTVNCVNLESGYAGAIYTLDITIETIQADQKWNYTPGHTYKVGEFISIENEGFNVIKDNGDTVTMLAQFNLDSTYRQSETANKMVFSNSNGWEYAPGPKEIDIQSYDGPVKTYVNNYVTYLKVETGDGTLTGTLITLTQLKDLGCTINDDYSYTGVATTCANSENANWLGNGQNWWTRSAYGSGIVWYVANGNILFDGVYNFFNFGVRPVITISKETLDNL